MSEFTKGPWNVGFNDGSGVTGGRTANTYITTDVEVDGIQQVVCEVRAEFYGKRVPVAENAHLISAAPDMYEALRELMTAFGEFENPPITDMRWKWKNEMIETLRKAQAAVAKAEGKP